jgi:hypothetical protein
MDRARSISSRWPSPAAARNAKTICSAESIG